jgi:carboxymethylenebutenolidase
MNNKSEIEDVSDEHIKCERVDKDVNATMKTMVLLTGGKGYNEVYNFYKRDFVGKTPKDFKVTNISCTISNRRRTYSKFYT